MVVSFTVASFIIMGIIALNSYTKEKRRMKIGVHEIICKDILVTLSVALTAIGAILFIEPIYALVLGFDSSAPELRTVMFVLIGGMLFGIILYTFADYIAKRRRAYLVHVVKGIDRRSAKRQAEYDKEYLRGYCLKYHPRVWKPREYLD